MLRPGVFAGSTVRVTLTFKDPDSGVLLDVNEPVGIEVRPPPDDTGTPRSIIDVTATKVSTGIYTGAFLAEFDGRYTVKGTSSAPEPAVTWDELEVRPSVV